MKLFIITFVTLLSMLAFASGTCDTTATEVIATEALKLSTDVPNHLKGATITVRLADGTESTVPAEMFKVVPRKQQFIITKTFQARMTVCSADVRKNRASIMAGNGPKEGLERSNIGTAVAIESKVGTVAGVQYQRLITERVSLGAQLQSNKSALVNIGLDF